MSRDRSEVIPIRTIAGATGYSRPVRDAALHERRQRFLARLEALNNQLDGSTLEAALALMVAEYRVEAQARRQVLAFASGARGGTLDVGLPDDLDELAARIDLVATLRARMAED